MDRDPVREPIDLQREVRHFYTIFAASQFLIDSSIWSFYLTEYCRFSLAEALAFHAGTTAVGGLLDLPTGSWADRFGRKRIVLLGFLARALAATLMLVASSSAVLILVAIASGFGWAQLSGAMEAFLHDNLKARGETASFRRYMANALIVTYWSRTAAFVASGLLFTLHPTLPYVALITALLVGAYSVRAIQELPFEKTEATADLEHIVQGAKVFFSDRGLLRMMLLMLASFVVLEQLWFSFQPLLGAAQMRPIVVGMSYALGAFGSVCGAHIGKYLLSQHREGFACCLALAVCACGGLLFASVSQQAALVAAQFITCIGFGCIASTRSVILNRSLPSAHRAVCLSLFSSSEAVLMGLLGATLGYLYEHYDRSVPPTAVAVLCLLLIPALTKTLNRVGQRGV